GEICSWASSQRRNEGRSITLRARVEQKCDFRETLKNSINKLEALIGLRSGGLPEAHRKKIFLDALDLSITMRHTLYAFFNYNSNALDEDSHKVFVLEVQSWDRCYGLQRNRYGKLSTTVLPNSTKTLACLEKFFIEMEKVK
ncbi:27383_t:CDS:2, partial [Dentiscutata erythropus]